MSVTESDVPDDTYVAGSIRGEVTDSATNRGLESVTVRLVGADQTVITDSAGRFVIDRVGPGTYSLRYSLVGYDSLIQDSVVVRGGETTYVAVRLAVVAYESDPIIVTGARPKESDLWPASSFVLSGDRIASNAAAGGDISRLLASQPGVSRFDDHYNGIMVRGGNPMECGFYVDNIEVPNINHFPSQVSSAGAFSLIPADMIQNVTFHTGSFPAAFGDRLSSIVDISLKAGSTHRTGGRVNIGILGAEANSYGPLPDGHGSWIVAARRGFLDLVLDVLEADIAPKFTDAQGKLVYNTSSHSTASLLALYGTGDVAYSREEAARSGFGFFGSFDYTAATIGGDWQYRRAQSGTSSTALSYSRTSYKFNNADTHSGVRVHDNMSVERVIRLRTVNRYEPPGPIGVEFGLDLTHLIAGFDYEFAVYVDQFGQPTQDLDISESTEITKPGIFASLIIRPAAALSMSVGGRLDYHPRNRMTHVSPRLSLSYGITDWLSLLGAVGVHYQSLPPGIITQHESNFDLQDPRSVQKILGVTCAFSDNLTATLECYNKEYRYFPMDPMQPSVFLLDELVYYYGFFMAHGELTDAGEAFARGVEATLSGRISERTGGSVNASLFRSRYRGLDGVWRNRISDNRILFNVEVIHLFSRNWEIGAVWSFAGGAPYTPADSALSELHRDFVFDSTRVNEARLPDYHSLSIHLKRHFTFRGSCLTAYAGLWNAYDRRNTAGYTWDTDRHRPEPIEQLGLLPVIGLEYRF